MVTKQSITLAPPCPTCGEPITRPTCPVCYKRHPASQVPSPPPARGGFDRTALHSTRPTYSTRTHAADVEVLFPGLFTQAPQPQQPIDAEIALPGLFPPPAPQPQPASQRPTPRMFNGYEHPGPAPHRACRQRRLRPASRRPSSSQARRTRLHLLSLLAVRTRLLPRPRRHADHRSQARHHRAGTRRARRTCQSRTAPGRRAQNARPRRPTASGPRPSEPSKPGTTQSA